MPAEAKHAKHALASVGWGSRSGKLTADGDKRTQRENITSDDGSWTIVSYQKKRTVSNSRESGNKGPDLQRKRMNTHRQSQLNNQVARKKPHDVSPDEGKNNGRRRNANTLVTLVKGANAKINVQKL